MNRAFLSALSLSFISFFAFGDEKVAVQPKYWLVSVQENAHDQNGADQDWVHLCSGAVFALGPGDETLVLTPAHCNIQNRSRHDGTFPDIQVK